MTTLSKVATAARRRPFGWRPAARFGGVKSPLIKQPRFEHPVTGTRSRIGPASRDS